MPLETAENSSAFVLSASERDGNGAALERRSSRAFTGIDFAGLVARADAQYAKVDEQRASMAFGALRPGIARRAGA